MLVVGFGEIQAGFVEKYKMYFWEMQKHFQMLIRLLIFEFFHTCLGLDECLHLMGLQQRPWMNNTMTIINQTP